MANAGVKGILTVLFVVGLPRMALAQNARLEVTRQGGIFCPAQGARINVGFLNRTGLAQTIPAGTRVSLVFSFPVTEVPFNPSGIAFSFSGNTLTAELLTSFTVENESGLFFNSVALDLQSVTGRTLIAVTGTVDPFNALALAPSGTAILGLADPGACEPAAPSAFTVEDLTSGCPAAKEVAAFRAAVDLRLDSDPSAGALVCRAADGSADLTRLEERTFQAFRIMQFLPLDAPVPWTPKPLYDWFTGAIRGVRYRSDIPFSFCCEPAGYVNIQTSVGVLASPASPEAVISLADLLIHEARHSDGLPHTCGSWDQTLPELGAWGAVFYYNEWAAFRAGDFLKSKMPGRAAFYRTWTWGAAQSVLTGAICDHGGGVVISPLVADFGAQTVGVASAPRTLAITQTEGGPVTIGGVILEGANAADFAVTSPPCAGVTLPPSCAAVVRFTPRAAGPRSAQLRVAFSGSGMQRTVNLLGTGVAGPSCTYLLSSLGQSTGGSGGFGTVSIAAADGCGWEAASDAPWLSIASGRAGAGNGTLAFVAAPNPGTEPRTGRLAIAGQMFTVNQAGATIANPALIAVSNTQLQFYSVAGGAAPPAQSIGVSSIGPGTLSWTATSSAAWLTLSLTAAGFAVSANPAGLGVGPWKGTILVTAPGAINSPQMVSVVLTISASVPMQNPTAARFVPVVPCRIADTRNAFGPFGGPGLPGNTSRDFVIPGGPCGIPGSAVAYSVNIAVVPSGPLGYLTLWPTGQPQPLVATSNSDGRIKSNAALVPAGAGGAISVFVTDATDVVLDINGYFVAGNSPTALAFYPLTPCRIADTRNPTASLGGPSLAARSTRTFPILASACGLPSNAQAYSLNFAAVPTGPSLGYLTAWPAGQAQPLVASLNDPTGTILANAVVVPAGAGGAVNVFATDTADLVIDINGYFAPQGPGGLSLYTVPPCRVLDSRLPAGTPPFGATRDVNVTAAPCGVPAAAQAFVFSATVVPPGPLGFLTMWPQGQPQPLAATLNATDGAITNNMAIVPATNGSVSVFPWSPTHLVLDLFGFFAP